MKLFDCTLRDGGNVVGKGFSAELTKMMIEGLIKSNIKLIEMGNCYGIGAYEADKHIAPLTDSQYCDVVAPYLKQAEIGMFAGFKNTTPENVKLAADKGLRFLRVGANAGDGAMAVDAVKRVKAAGLQCRYSLMKGYVLSAKDLAAETAMLAKAGVDAITIMDSAGTMMPKEVSEYVAALVKAVDIPVGFHGHNNLGLSVANALAAAEAGAAELDTGLMGMARSAGNLSTEGAVAAFRRLNKLTEIDFYYLLHFIDEQLAPAMEKHNYVCPIKPVDIVYGAAGCHSNFAARFEAIAKEKNVDLYKLIIEASVFDRKAPSEELIRRTAEKLK